jgi:hypothetical protein
MGLSAEEYEQVIATALFSAWCARPHAKDFDLRAVNELYFACETESSVEISREACKVLEFAHMDFMEVTTASFRRFYLLTLRFYRRVCSLLIASITKHGARRTTPVKRLPGK